MSLNIKIVPRGTQKHLIDIETFTSLPIDLKFNIYYIIRI